MIQLDLFRILNVGCFNDSHALCQAITLWVYWVACTSSIMNETGTGRSCWCCRWSSWWAGWGHRQRWPSLPSQHHGLWESLTEESRRIRDLFDRLCHSFVSSLRTLVSWKSVISSILSALKGTGAWQLNYCFAQTRTVEYHKPCQRSHVPQNDSQVDTVWSPFSLVLVLRKCGRRHPSVSQSVCSDVRWVHGAVWVGLPIIHPGSSNIVYNRYIGTTRCLLLQ